VEAIWLEGRTGWPTSTGWTSSSTRKLLALGASPHLPGKEAAGRGEKKMNTDFAETVEKKENEQDFADFADSRKVPSILLLQGVLCSLISMS
jgi:hypothetical protein